MSSRIDTWSAELGQPSRRLMALAALLAQFGIAACGGAAAGGKANSSAATAGTPGAQTTATASQATGGTGPAGGMAPRPTEASAGQRAAPSSAATAAQSSGAGTAGASAQPSSAGATAPEGDTPGTAGTAAAGGSSGAAAGSGAAGSGAAGSGALQPCPTSNVLKAGDNRKSLMHGGRERRFNVYVPSSIPAMTRVPLVLDFHGNGSSGMQEQSGSGWQQKADAEKFIVVYPDGIGNGWNVGNCCGEALNSMVDDVGFARALVENVSSEACVDAQRVYATGIFNGAGLAHRLACEAADVFAAIAAASADLVTDPCTPARPISELSVRGLNDTLVAYEGGNTGSTGWYSPGAKGTLELWKTINGCMGAASTTLEHCETYTQCNGGVEVTLCSLPNTGHILYSNSLDFSVPDNAWQMFERQTLP